MHLINWYSSSVSTSIKVEVLAVCLSGEFKCVSIQCQQVINISNDLRGHLCCPSIYEGYKGISKQSGGLHTWNTLKTVTNFPRSGCPSKCGDCDFFPSFIYIFDAGWFSCLVFRLGWTAGRSALTIPTCGWSSIWHQLKPALSWAPVSDDCLSSLLHACLLLRSAWDQCPAQCPTEPASSPSPSLSSRAPTRNRWHSRPTHLTSPARSHLDTRPSLLRPRTQTRCLLPPHPDPGSFPRFLVP